MSAQETCAACETEPRASAMTGCLCAECDAVTATFSDKQWARVGAMTKEQANAYLLERRGALRTRLGRGWWR